jgi:hypothetical protein
MPPEESGVTLRRGGVLAVGVGRDGWAIQLSADEMRSLADALHDEADALEDVVEDAAAALARVVARGNA